MNAPVHITPATLSTRLSGAGRGVLALGLLGAWLIVMRRQGWVEESGGGIFSLGFLLVAGTVGGSVAAIFKLPRLTGYLAVGVISGPYVLELFTVNDVKSLTLINGLALALIALQAGAELTIPMLKRSLRSLSWASLTHSVFITGGMTLLFAGCALFLDFTQGLSWAAIFAVGGVWGAMAVSKAPADTLAILGETGARGPLPEHALGVVVVLDVVVLVLFAIALMVAKSALIPGEELSVAVLEHLGVELIASVAAGTTFGLVIAFYFWAIGRERLLFTVAAAYGITAFCAYFQYDTLLVFVVAGFVVMNLTREGHTLVETTESVGSAVMVVFFATAGAQLDVGAMAVYGPIALVLAGGRIFLTFVACRAGHRLAEDPEVVRKYAWTSFISQAGVTIGLGTIAANALGDVGAGISTLIIAVIGVNEVIGPVAFKVALGKAAVDTAREERLAAETSEETIDEEESVTVQPEILRAALELAFEELDVLRAQERGERGQRLPAARQRRRRRGGDPPLHRHPERQVHRRAVGAARRRRTSRLHAQTQKGRRRSARSHRRSQDRRGAARRGVRDRGRRRRSPADQKARPVVPAAPAGAPGDLGAARPPADQDAAARPRR
jgi:Kef-type K+ transport system membrane component KefB